MNVRRLLLVSVFVFASAGLASAAPGDLIFDSGASQLGERGVAVFEGASETEFVFVEYLNMDDVAGLSDGDEIVRVRTAGVRRIKERPPVRASVVVRGPVPLNPR